MVEPMLAEAREQHMEPLLSPDTVKAAIWDFVLQARAVWKAPKPRVHLEGERLETTDEARVRTQSYGKFRARAVRSTTRKREVSFLLYISLHF